MAKQSKADLSTPEEAQKADAEALVFAEKINQLDRAPAEEYVRDNMPSVEVIVALVGALGRVTGRTGGRPDNPDDLIAQIRALNPGNMSGLRRMKEKVGDLVAGPLLHKYRDNLDSVYNAIRKVNKENEK